MRATIVAQVAVGFTGLAMLCNAADWPQWRGPERSEVSQETGLLKQWPAAGPKSVWLYQKAGNGYSGPAVVGGSLYVMGARGDTEFLVALSTAAGEEQWATEIGPRYKNNWGDGSRGTPTVSAGRVYAMGGQGTLVAVNAQDGQLLWKKTMAELGGKVPQWGYSESLLVEGNRVICTPGGAQGAVAALDKDTGNLLWQCKEFTEGAQYSSPILVKHNGVSQVNGHTDHLFHG